MRTSMRLFILSTTAVLALGACSDFDPDLRGLGKGFDTSDAVTGRATPRPEPDSRGVISYPSYQVAVARRGDTVADVAARVGLPANEVARFNGVPAETALNKDEILALPRRVPETTVLAAGATGGVITSAGGVDIETLAGDAIDRATPQSGASGASGATQTAAKPKTNVQTGPEPVRHKVERGETAYSIARLYGVSAASLAEWNGLNSDLTVRQGQYLLIPVVESTSEPAPVPEPGAGSPTPVPPSATTPLPDEKTSAAGSTAAPGTPPSPELKNEATEASASNSRMQTPVAGSVIRDFTKGKNDGIDISAKAGAPVQAAAAGTVAAITEDTDRVPIIVLRHADGLLTVYANVDSVKVKKGQTISRGQSIAVVRSGNPSFVHFEVRDGLEAVDPTPYLN